MTFEKEMKGVIMGSTSDSLILMVSIDNGGKKPKTDCKETQRDLVSQAFNQGNLD